MDKKSLIFLFFITAAFLFTQQYFDAKREAQLKNTSATSEKPAMKEELPREEKNSYYVLKSPYQELVFSEKGGSLVEINLPFKTDKSSKSAVLKVENDETLHQDFPQVEAKDSSGNVVQSSTETAYPLLRRFPWNDALAQHRSCALSSSYPEFASLPYAVTQFTKNSITFEAHQSNRTIIKKYSFPEDTEKYPYCFTLDLTIKGDKKGIFLSSGIPEVELISGSTGATLKYRMDKGNKAVVEKVNLPSDTFTSTTISPDWVCNTNGFFGIIIDPLKTSKPGFSFERVAGSTIPSRLEKISTLSESDHAGYEAKVPVSSKEETASYRIYAGPLSEKILSTVDENALIDHAKPTNYLETQTFHGFFAFIAEPFAKFLFFIMKFFHNLFGSWALSIILATVALRILLYPLNAWSMKSTKAMQEIGPQIKAIQEKYKKEPAKAQMEMMNLYKEKKVNPFSGCLPMLIQMPFLLGMFDLLKTSFELRGAPFIPGWINNLAAPDTLFTFPFSIPFIGNEFHLLPLLLGATMYVQQMISSNLPKDQSLWTDQQRQQKAMGMIMTVVMTVMFYQFPAGLNIYWISSMLLGIIQQWWTNRSTITT